MPDRLDLLILGSGSTAFAAALRARELGKTVVMTEERPIGGTCVNRGCLPSKNLIGAAKLVHDARHPRYPGLRPAELGVDFAKLIEQKDAVVHDYRKQKYESLLGKNIRVEKGHARFIDPRTVAVDGKQFVGDRVLIATGSHPVLPQVEALQEVEYLTSDLLTVDEPTELRELPESLVIVGGGYIALELGQMFSHLGTTVTILERSPQLLRGYEPEVGRTVAAILTREGIEIVFNATAQAARPETSDVVVTAAVAGKERDYRAQRILVATGRQPNTDGIAAERAGVEVNGQGEVVVDHHLRTKVAHVFAAGDVIGTQHGSEMATPVGSRQGAIAAHNALSSEPLREVDHRVVPRTIFLDPEVAVVGMTEAAVLAAGRRCWCSTIPISLVPRADAIRDTRGMIKMVADADTNEVLGVSMVSHNAGEVIHEAAMALRFRATIQDFIDLLHVFPTMAEALKIVAISRFKDPAKLSCCAE
jgi:mercuric reductase